MIKQINWLTWEMNHLDGYGSYSISSVLELAARGYLVRPMHVREVESILHMDERVRHLANISFDGITLMALPGENMPPVPGRRWGLSMYEDTSIPNGWAEQINRNCERLIVPCEFYQAVFRKKGVTVPVHVVYGGTDPVEFALMPQGIKDRPFTFVCLGDRGVRKGTEEVVNAFRREFKRERDVRLIIKTRPNMHPGRVFEVLEWSDSRIEVWREDVKSMRRVYEAADCYVYPSYGDGWGKTPREAVMCGVPTIAPRHTGLEVGIDSWATVILEQHTMEKSNYNTSDGYWHVPVLEEVQTAMRWAYECRDDARMKAVKGSKWLRAHQTWKQSIDMLEHLFEVYE